MAVLASAAKVRPVTNAIPASSPEPSCAAPACQQASAARNWPAPPASTMSVTQETVRAYHDLGVLTSGYMVEAATVKLTGTSALDNAKLAREAEGTAERLPWARNDRSTARQVPPTVDGPIELLSGTSLPIFLVSL
jgi:hypothetical protein